MSNRSPAASPTLPGAWPAWARRHGWHRCCTFTTAAHDVPDWPETPHGYTYAMVNAKTGTVAYIGHAGGRCGARFNHWFGWLTRPKAPNPIARDAHRAAFTAPTFLYVRPARLMRHMGQEVTDMQITETAAIQRWNPTLVKRREGARR